MTEPVKSTYIYVISSPIYKSGYYKIGYHTGNQNKLIARYRTSLGEVHIHLFLETKNHRKVESMIFETLKEKRCKGNKQKSEIFKASLETITKAVYKNIAEYGEIDHHPDKHKWCTIL